MAMKPEDFDRLVNKIINEDWYDETDWSANGKKNYDRASKKKTFLNDEEDLNWLRSTHCRDLPREAKSFILYGNEDSPSRVEAFDSEDPEIGDKPIYEKDLMDHSKMNEGSEGGNGEMEKKIEYALDSIERMADVQHMVKGTRFGLGLDQSVLNMPVKGTSRTLGEQITFCYNGIRTLKNLVKRGESAQQISNRMNDSVFKDMYWPIGADEEGVNSFLEAIEEELVKYGASPDDIKKMIWHLNWAIESANRNLSSICESCGPIKESDEGDEEENEVESEPAPEDYTMTPSGHLGGLTAVAQVEGKFLGEFDSDQEAIDFIKRRMEKEQYWPAVWYISDHGNISPVTINFNS